MIDKLARDADSLIYMGHPRYDMQLLDTMKRIVEADTENDLLFILHCYGSHFSYHQRYPREAAYFLPDDDVAIERQHKQKIWNAYDNSIRYTDTFLSSVIGYLGRRHMRFFRPSPTSPVSRRITFTGRRRWQVPPTIRRCGAVTSTITTVPYRSVRRDSTGPTLPISVGGVSNCSGGRSGLHAERNRRC